MTGMSGWRRSTGRGADWWEAYRKRPCLHAVLASRAFLAHLLARRAVPSVVPAGAAIRAITPHPKSSDAVCARIAVRALSQATR